MSDGHELVHSDWHQRNHCLAPVTHWGPGPAGPSWGKVFSGPSPVTNPTLLWEGASCGASEQIKRGDPQATRPTPVHVWPFSCEGVRL